MAFHGTPGSRIQMSYDQAAIDGSGVRLIAVDRPGYGHSTFHKGRRLSDWPNDVAQLADHLKLKQFSVVGVSGGGPHAVVCARYLPDRVSTAGIVSGVGPMAEPTLGGGDVTGVNRTLTRLAARSPSLLYPVFWAQDFAVRRWPEAVLRAAAKQMPAADVAALGRADVKAAFLEDGRRASKTTPQAAAQDFALFARDWAFELEDIEVPVHIWHGDADRNVPIAHARHLAARIPEVQLHELEGEGHLLAVDHLEEILRTVSVAASG
jgi:pimeloyl-ACP methyl ester carboxylesterase